MLSEYQSKLAYHKREVLCEHYGEYNYYNSPVAADRYTHLFVYLDRYWLEYIAAACCIP